MRWLIILILMLPMVMATQCEDVLDPGQECQMWTPYLANCTVFNYSVSDLTGVINTNNLTYVEPGLYYLNFSQDPGGYIVRLCDNSTREIVVRNTLERDNQMISIVLGPIILIVMYLVLAFLNIRFKLLNPTGKSHWIYMLCFLMAGLQIVYILAITAANYNGTDISNIMQINFLVNLFTLLGAVFFSLIMSMGVVYTDVVKDVDSAWKKK